MSGQLERFINDHREEFDGEEPAKKIWDGIRQKLEPERQASRVVRMGFKRWSIAASVAILVIAGTVYLLVRRSDAFSVTPVAAVPGSVPKKSVPPANHILPDSALPRPAIRQLATVKGQNRIEGSSRKSQGEDISSDVSKEMVYYAKIVELKHDELKKIKKDEPLLYKQFSSDVYKLDTVYQSLKKQLPKNPNREQLLEAMIQNLQLQMELLNRQLNIIKQINNSKKSAYEQAYKSA